MDQVMPPGGTNRRSLTPSSPPPIKRRRLLRSPSPLPPPPLAPSALKWGEASQRAQTTIEHHIQVNENHRVKRLSGNISGVPRLVDLVGNRLSTADINTIQDTLAEIPPLILQNNLWRWHRIPYTILRQTLLRLLSGHQSGLKDSHASIDEWILSNEKWLRDADSLPWQQGLVTLEDAEYVFPEYVLAKSERTIGRPWGSLTGIEILNNASELRIAIQPSTAAFKRNFSRLSDRLLTNLDWSNLIVAGGIVLGALMATGGARHWDASGIDIYLYGLSPSDANKKIRHVFDTFCANLPPGTRTFTVRNSKTITFYAKYPMRRLQIVLKLLKSPRDVLLNFDLDICAMGWDGSNLWMLPRAARALETGSNVFTMSLIHGHYLSERRASQPQRIFKYASRGYGLRFLPSYVSSLETKSRAPSAPAPPLTLKSVADGTRLWARNWLRATFQYPSRTISPRVFPGYSLSGFAMLMRPTTLWELGQMGDVEVSDDWSGTSSYEDIPQKNPDPE
ncbi:hypothetical protein DFH06DRAFT_1131900 [Mycena polygramma]|nr:hypothetical protein DFH06DRAFT_1131900 [Mycena polygramma]